MALSIGAAISATPGAAQNVAPRPRVNLRSIASNNGAVALAHLDVLAREALAPRLLLWRYSRFCVRDGRNHRPNLRPHPKKRRRHVIKLLIHFFHGDGRDLLLEQLQAGVHAQRAFRDRRGGNVRRSLRGCRGVHRRRRCDRQGKQEAQAVASHIRCVEEDDDGRRRT